jgi:hypothetical protein
VSNENIEQLAVMIALNPKLRNEYFVNPGKVLARAMPRQGLLGRILPGVPEQTKALRAELAVHTEDILSKDGRLVSFRESYQEEEAFLKEGMQNPQTTFDTILRLSIGTFLVGVSLVVGAFLGAFLGDGTAEKALIGGLSGGGGLVAVLTSVFATARDAIRRINGDYAQISVILTSYAMQVTHLRAIRIKTFEDAKERHEEVRRLRADVLAQIEEYMEPKPKAAEERVATERISQEEGPGEESGAEGETSTDEVERAGPGAAV